MLSIDSHERMAIHVRSQRYENHHRAMTLSVDILIVSFVQKLPVNYDRLLHPKVVSSIPCIAPENGVRHLTLRAAEKHREQEYLHRCRYLPVFDI